MIPNCISKTQPHIGHVDPEVEGEFKVTNHSPVRIERHLREVWLEDQERWRFTSLALDQCRCPFTDKSLHILAAKLPTGRWP